MEDFVSRREQPASRRRGFQLTSFPVDMDGSRRPV
jgi:hypothetical protein